MLDILLKLILNAQDKIALFKCSKIKNKGVFMHAFIYEETKYLPQTKLKHNNNNKIKESESSFLPHRKEWYIWIQI